MKLIKLSALLVLALAMTLGATGCKKNIYGPTPLHGSRTGPVGDDRPITDTTTPFHPDSDTAEGVPMDDTWDPMDTSKFDHDTAALAAYTVYFAFDSSSVRSGEESKVDSVASALSADMQARLLIEGHCDERGTEEYNRSLGERRALALREALISKGINPNRVKTISYGEDRPAEVGHNEAAWSKNRRGVFVLLHPKM